MAEDLGHGARLTADEYERRIVELHRNLPPIPSREMERAIRRKELDLAIDHRLGANFPADRRDRLWSILQRVERRRVWLALKYLVRRGMAPRPAAGAVHPQAERVAGFMVDAFAGALDERELKSFFDLEPGDPPRLPLDSGL